MNSRVTLLAALAACGGVTAKDVVVDPNDVGAGKDSDGDGYVPNPGEDTQVEQGPVYVEIVHAPFAVEVGETEQAVDGTMHHETLEASELTLTASSDRDGEMEAPTVAEDGSFVLGLSKLKAGRHDITVQARDPEGNIATDDVRVGICDYLPTQTFDGSPIGVGWQSYGDAHWDPQGWMEITGNAGSRAGSIYKIDRKVDPGDFRLTFRIATGGGINGGADGYAVNIVNVRDVEALEAYINAASNGGCLGYAITDGCGDAAHGPVDAFHIEFDTWYNGEYDDPPSGANHIGIMLDGSAKNHLLWSPFQLETNPLVWHDVDVQAQGTVISVSVDGQVIINQSIEGFQFDGGFIGVSGSTGWASNYHRFDDLRIYDRCIVPGQDEDLP